MCGDWPPNRKRPIERTGDCVLIMSSFTVISLRGNAPATIFNPNRKFIRLPQSEQDLLRSCYHYAYLRNIVWQGGANNEVEIYKRSAIGWLYPHLLILIHIEYFWSIQRRTIIHTYEYIPRFTTIYYVSPDSYRRNIYIFVIHICLSDNIYKVRIRRWF